MTKLAIVLFSLILATAAHARRDNWASNPIQLPSDAAANQLRDVYVRNCLSWRLAVEANNYQKWKLVPEQCVNHVENYMLNTKEDQTDPQYVDDVDLVVDLAVDYLRTVTPTEGGNDTWLFGLTNTLLSDIEYYSRPDVRFGATPYNKTKYYEWYATGNMPAVPHIDDLFYEAKNKGFKIVILSGVAESFRSVVEENLQKANFWGWDRLILNNKPSQPTRDFKASTRAQLRKEGYKVIGNIGDQWIDLLTGSNAGKRTFKLPNPMYYVY